MMFFDRDILEPRHQALSVPCGQWLNIVKIMKDNKGNIHKGISTLHVHSFLVPGAPSKPLLAEDRAHEGLVVHVSVAVDRTQHPK